MGRYFSYRIVKKGGKLPSVNEDLNEEITTLKNRWKGPISDITSDDKYTLISRQELYDWFQEYMKTNDFFSIHGWDDYCIEYTNIMAVGEILSFMQEGDSVAICYW